MRKAVHHLRRRSIKRALGSWLLAFTLPSPAVFDDGCCVKRISPHQNFPKLSTRLRAGNYRVP
jgi:hypothetical protein